MPEVLARGVATIRQSLRIIDPYGMVVHTPPPVRAEPLLEPVTDAASFERNYAARSGLTVEELRALGRTVAPCDCGDDLCEGWQSVGVGRA